MVAGKSGFGRGAIATFTPPITAHGGEVVQSFIVPPSTTDYSAVLEEVRGLHPDVVGMFGDAVRVTPRSQPRRGPGLMRRSRRGCFTSPTWSG